MSDNKIWEGSERRKKHDCQHDVTIALILQDVKNGKENYQKSINNLQTEMEKTTTLSLEILGIMKGDGSHDKPGILTELAVTKENIKRLRLYLSGIASVLGGYLLTKIKW